VTALEWLVIIEVIVLGAIGLFSFVSLVISRTHPDDPIVIFCRTFWMTFIYAPPEKVGRGGFEVRPSAAREMDESPSPPAREAKAKRGGKSKQQPGGDDAFYGRVKAGDDGVIHTATLNVVVLPHSEKDDVLGKTSDGIELMVTSAAEDGASNKAVIQLVSKALGVKPYQVTLTKGHYQTRKAVAVTGMDQAELDEKIAAIE
jgi:uncharacterized protein YggU (UPF0235/DUF167 family)